MKEESKEQEIAMVLTMIEKESTVITDEKRKKINALLIKELPGIPKINFRYIENNEGNFYVVCLHFSPDKIMDDGIFMISEAFYLSIEKIIGE